MADVDVTSMWERHAARRTFPLLARTKVCRSLFGPVDHEELNCEMKRKLQEMSERDQSRWNFNFEHNLPLPGHYEWEEITSGSVPAFYQESVPNGKSRTGASLSQKETDSAAQCGCKNDLQSSAESAKGEVNQENRAATLNARKAGLATAVCRRRKRASVSETLRNNTPHITDFFPRRKRSIDSKPTERTSQAGSSMPSEIVCTGKKCRRSSVFSAERMKDGQDQN